MGPAIPAPLDQGLATWRASEATRRLVLYALLAALAYPLLMARGSLPLQIASAGLCLSLAAVVLVVPRMRDFAPWLQIANVGALIVLAAFFFVETPGSVLSLGVVMLAIFGSQYAFVRRRDLAAVYAFGTLALVLGSVLRGELTAPWGLASVSMIVAAFVVAYATGALQISAQNNLVHERLKKTELAHVDELTGLPSRSVLFERLDGALASARRRKHDVAVLYVDLDRFKRVNDTYGHRAGDHVLVQVGCRLKRAVRTDEIAARIGGDEFVVLLPHVSQFNEPDEAAARFARILEEPYVFEGERLEIGASIGVARSPYDGFERARLLASADAAMYARKREPALR